MKTFQLNFWFEWGGGCLWPDDESSRREFDLGPYDVLEPCPLPLSQEVLQQCRNLTEWHDTSLNWEYPPDPGPWRQPECDRFNAAAAQLLADIRQELGSSFLVIDCRFPCVEDPELDNYLMDPKGFRRK